MAYISSSEGFRQFGLSGCGGKCRCSSCASRTVGNYGLAEWYEREDEEEPETRSGPASPQFAVNNRGGAGMGEPPLELQTPRLLPRRPPYSQSGPYLLPPVAPPILRRMQGTLSRDLPPLTLQTQFRPTPGQVTVPPPRLPDLRLSPEYQRRLMEQWERERINRILTTPPPPPLQRRSLGEAIRNYLDNNLDRLMSDLGVPRSLRGHIRGAARDAIGRGATELLDRALTGAGIGSEAREAITSSVRAAMEQIRVR